MFVACCDHGFGISTPRCSKTTSPRSLPITADRVSHSISSNGSTPARLKTRGNAMPAPPLASGSGVASGRGVPVSLVVAVAIVSLGDVGRSSRSVARAHTHRLLSLPCSLRFALPLPSEGRS